MMQKDFIRSRDEGRKGFGVYGFYGAGLGCRFRFRGRDGAPEWFFGGYINLT